MSHFYTMVIVPKGTVLGAIEKTVSELVARYDENIEVPTHPEACYCIGSPAWRAAEKAAAKKFGTIEQLRERFDAQHSELKKRGPFDAELQETWEQFIAPFSDAKRATFEAHPSRTKPDPKCPSCKGSGSYETTTNPDSKWDWWRIGGRWDGVIQNDARSSENGFNFGAAHTQLKNNVRLVGELIDAGQQYIEALRRAEGRRSRIPETVTNPFPFAVVTPDGAWHQKGQMGWFGAVAQEKTDVEFYEQVLALWKGHRDSFAVGCDMHI